MCPQNVRVLAVAGTMALR